MGEGKKKYRVKVSFDCEVEGESEQDAATNMSRALRYMTFASNVTNISIRTLGELFVAGAGYSNMKDVPPTAKDASSEVF